MNTKALRQKVLDLAIHGKLVPQNPNDESAEVLLKKIREEKAEKIKKGELKADKKDSFIFTKECEFDEDKLGKCSSGTRHKRHYEQFADGTVKDIEDEIPFEVPEGWAWCRLGELFYHTTGKALKKSNNKGSLRKYITTSNLYWNKFDFTEVREMYFTNDELDKCTIKKGDLVLCNGGDVGRAAIWNFDEDICYQNHVSRLRPKIIGINNKLYLYLLMFYKEQGMLNGKGVGITSLSANDLLSGLFPLPPINEQDQIVIKIENIFSQIDYIDDNKSDLQTAINKTKSKILDLVIHGKLVPQDPNDEPAEELLKRISTSDNRPYEKVDEEPFEIPDSWKWVKLNDLAEIARGGSPRPIQDYITEDKDGINWIKIGDTIEESKYITSSKEKIKPEGKKHSRYVHAGDFLLTNSMSFGRPYILKIDGCIHDGWLVFANIKECLLQDYLYYALSSAYIYETFSNVAAGSTVKNLKSDTVKQVDFPLPPLSEQKRIVEAIENMYEVLDQIQNNLV